MLGVTFPLKGIGGNGAKVYRCFGCGGLITYSDRLLRIGTSHRHLFVNPAGVECDFYSFADCPGAVWPMEVPAKPTPGFLALGGAWLSAGTVLSTLGGTMKPCPYSKVPENFGVYLSIT